MLGRCRGCEAKDLEIERLNQRLDWAQGQIDTQNKRLSEIASPGANMRIARASGITLPRPVPVPRPLPASPPGFESIPEEAELAEEGA